MPASREYVIEEVGETCADVRTYLDGSGIGGGIGAVAVLYRNREEKKVLRMHLGTERQHTIFGAELVSLQQWNL